MRKIILVFIIIMVINIISDKGYAYTNGLYITVAPKSINFQLIAPNGNASGYDANAGGILSNISYMGDYIEGGDDTEYPNNNPFSEWHKLFPNGSNAHIATGKYKLILYGITLPTQAKIGIDIDWSGNSQWHMGSVLGEYIMPNVVWTYEFDIPVTPPANRDIILIKVSDPNDLIADINALAKEDYIGNPKFVSELIKEINEIEAEKAKGKIDDSMTPAQKAKKEYQELLKELDEKNTKPEKDEFVDELALYILQRDIDYIINHIQ